MLKNKFPLEKTRSKLFLAGLCFSAAIVLSAFEYRVPVEDKLTDCPRLIQDLRFEPSPPSPPDRPKKPIEVSSTTLSKKQAVEQTTAQRQPMMRLASMAVTTTGNTSDEFTNSNERGVAVPGRNSGHAVTRMPALSGCMSDNPESDWNCTQRTIKSYLQENIEYPAICSQNGIQGTVMVAYTIDETGRITDIEVTRSVHPALDEEAKRLVKGLPLFMPAMQNGNPVAVKHRIPISFRLK